MKSIEGIVTQVIMAFLCVTSPAGWTYLVGRVLIAVECLRGRKSSSKKSVFQVAATVAIPAFVAAITVIATKTFFFAGILDFFQETIFSHPTGIWLCLPLLLVAGFWAAINYSTLHDLTQGDEKKLSGGPSLSHYPHFWL